MIVKNKIGEIILLIFLLITSALGISAFTMSFKKCGEKFIRGRNTGGPSTEGNATMTYYNSYPTCCKDSPVYCKADETTECKDDSGCKWMGLMAACNDNKIPEDYLKTNFVVAFMSKAQSKLKTKDERMKYWTTNNAKQNIEITLSYQNKSLTFNAIILDTCDDTDCNGCCSKHMGNKDALIDIEYESLYRLSNENKQFTPFGKKLIDYFIKPCNTDCITCDDRIKNQGKCSDKCGRGTIVDKYIGNLPFNVSWKFVKNKIKPPKNCNNK